MVCMPFGGRRLERLVNRFRFPRPDVVADREIGDQDLARQTTPGLVGPGQKDLRHDAEEVGGELDADLVLLFRREYVDDPVHRLHGARRMERPEDQVAGFGRGDGDPDCFEIAHFSDQDDVRVLAKSVFESVLKRQRVVARPDLALRDVRFLRIMEIFDRVFDRHDMVAARRVDRVDHEPRGSWTCRFPSARSRGRGRAWPS